MTESDEIPASCAAWLASHPEWAPIPGFANGYEASHRGNGVRSIDRKQGNRQLRGVNLKSRLNPDRYPVINLTGDDGRRVPGMPVHTCVLLAHDGPPPPGMECRHVGRGQQDSRYCGCGDPGCTQSGLRYGSKKENHADQVAAGTAVVPEAFECVNYDYARCGGMVRTAGRRCFPCLEATGRYAARLLDLRTSSQDAGEHFGYTDGRWVVGLAMKFGGYQGTLADARAQRPTLVQRVRIAGVLREARRAGVLAGDRA